MAFVSNNDGVSIRESDAEDLRSFNALVNTSGGAVFFRATFGQYNFSTLSEMSDVSLIATCEDDTKCIGYMSVADCIGIGKEGDAFDNTLLHLQEIKPELNNYNSLFINFLLLDERDTYDMDAVGDDLLYNAFLRCPECDYILWLCPKSVKLTSWTTSNFSIIQVQQEEKGSSGCGIGEGGESKEEGDGETKAEQPADHADLAGVRVLCCSREDILPKLLVRHARIEDNDDLVPILRESNPAALEGHGDFFLADLIVDDDEGNNFFVGVSKNAPVGMLATSQDVNVQLIRKVFNTDLYQDMFIEKEKTPSPPPLGICLLGDLRALSKSFLAQLYTETQCLLLDVENMGLPPVPPYKEGQDGVIADADLDLAESVVAQINAARDKAVAESCATGAPAPFVVLQGFPRCDAEAQLLAQNKVHFDLVLEIRDDADDAAEVDENDDFLISHHEAIEAYQSFLSIDNAPQWQRASLGADDNSCDEDFRTIFGGMVAARVEELAAIAAKEAEEPPKPNAFAITVFSMKDGHQSRCDDILKVVFEDHPDLDYSLFMVPNNSSANHETTNYITNSMIRVDLRAGVSFDQTLYICHRDTFLAKTSPIRVTRLADGSNESVQSFVEPLGGLGEEIVKDVADAMKLNDMDLKDNPAAASFGIKLMGELVGVVVVNRRYIGNDDINWLRANFHIEEVVQFDRHRAKAQAYVTQFVMNPVLTRFSRFVLRELMRLCGKSLLYYQNASPGLYPASKEMVHEMAAVVPRRRMQSLPGQSVPLLARPSAGPAADKPLFHITKNLIATPKKTVLKRVVVVGGSEASYAFLEKLAFEYANYPHLYLITDMPHIAFKPKGVKTAGINDMGAESEMAFVNSYTDSVSGCLSPQDADDHTVSEMMAGGLAGRVTLVRGRLTDIDRASKAIVVSDETVVEYDVLVLASPVKDRTFLEFPTTKNMHISRCELSGIFGIGDVYTDKAAAEWVLRLQKDKEKWPLVLYGHGLGVIGALANLMKLGVPLRRVTIIFKSDDLPPMPHDSLSEAIIRGLRSSGVVLHRSSKIRDVKLSSYDKIESVIMEKIPSKADRAAAELSGKELIPVLTELPCFSLINCSDKSCDPDLFTAINNCGVVYDGGVVVDKDFRTVDPNIYAVGDISCYSRVHMTELPHSEFNPLEIGAYVASVIMNKHMFSPRGPSCSFKPKNGMPEFTMPKTFSLQLAGGRLFFHSKLPREYHDCNVMLTGDLQSDGMAVVKVSPFGIVVEIAYLGKQAVEARNLSKLVGWHEAYLNEATHSYEEGMVSDWVDFFREEWATAIYHDKFALFVETLRTLLASDKGVYTILDHVSDALDRTTDNDQILGEWKNSIGPRGLNLDENTKRIVETQTIEYLRTNRHMLTRFSLPTKKKDNK